MQWSLMEVIKLWLVSSFFVSWPIMAKYLGVHPSWSALLTVSIATPIVMICKHETLTMETMPVIKVFLIYSLFCVANGLAVAMYTSKIETLKHSVGLYVASVSVTMVIMAAILGFILKMDLITLKQAAGILLAVFSIFLINS